MPDQVGSQLPPGAGRFQDFLWPDLTTAATGASASIRPRDSGGAAAPGAVITIGAGLGAIATVINGVPCQQLVSSVGNGSQRLFYPGFPIMLRTSLGNIDGRTDDCAVYRILVNMAGQGFNGPPGDYGFQIVQNLGAVDSRIVGAVNPGFGLQITDANNVIIVARGPNGLQVSVVASGPPFDTTQFHSYELRLFSATATAAARLALLIDSVPVVLPAAFSSWAAGTNLPPAAVVGGVVGFVPSIVATAEAATGLFVQSCRLIAAPTELMTL